MIEVIVAICVVVCIAVVAAIAVTSSKHSLTARQQLSVEPTWDDLA
jgi:hypothetical protein